jgi:type IV secretory pathway VirJ component
VSRRSIRAAAAAALLCLSCSVFGSIAHAANGGRYGDVQVIEPPGPLRGLVIFFSDHRGITAANNAAALLVTKAGLLVVEVDTPSYLNRLDKLNEKCHMLFGDVDGLSRRMQRESRFSSYFTPIVAGIGEGGTLAELTLAQAPAVTIAGAISLDPTAIVTSRQPICAQSAIDDGHGGFRYGPPGKLPGRWTVGFTSEAQPSQLKWVASMRLGGGQVEIKVVGRGVSNGEALLSLLSPYVPRPAEAAANVASLPLTILPVAHPSRVMAVVMSGDGGWRDLDKTIAEDLQGQGIPVVGWDSLRYFWSKKSPERTASDLATVLETFLVKWHANRVALIGYSFGADVLPFAYNRLPESLRSHIALIALLGLSKSADFEISVGEFLGEASRSGAVAVGPELSMIPPSLIQCFYGQGEEDTACPGLASRGVEVIRTTGGHHFDGDYPALARRIIAALRHQGATS